MSDLIKNIESIINNYGQYHSEMNIERLLSDKDKLVCYLYTLADQLSAARYQYKMQELINKKNILSDKIKNIEQSDKSTVAGDKAFLKNFPYLEKFVGDECDFYKLDTLIYQANSVVSAMTQRIGILKIEYEKTIFEQSGKRKFS